MSIVIERNTFLNIVTNDVVLARIPRRSASIDINGRQFMDYEMQMKCRQFMKSRLFQNTENRSSSSNISVATTAETQKDLIADYAVMEKNTFLHFVTNASPASVPSICRLVSAPSLFHNDADSDISVATTAVCPEDLIANYAECVPAPRFRRATEVGLYVAPALQVRRANSL
jgi:hypothetical protein